MNKINLKGITSEAVTGVLILVVALINAVLQRPMTMILCTF